ncbi:RalA-binding protein 1 [Coemansia sp. BCRC 34301]|nr:RalA-binding protein 1 [Coemansia sp. BCRC 34301]
MSDTPSNTVAGHQQHQAKAAPISPDATTADSIDAASRKAFSSTALYLQSELEATGSDLQLLEKLNDASIAKYEGLSRQAQDMLVYAYKVKQAYNEMETHVAEVDSLVESINGLEQVAMELDRYSLQLEAKFQKLLK